MTPRRKRHTMSTGEIAIRSFLVVKRQWHVGATRSPTATAVQNAAEVIAAFMECRP